MRAGTFSIITIGLLFAGSTFATIIPIDLSPAPGSALSAVNYASGDHAVGIQALNAVAQPASSASGGEIGPGIFFDDVSKLLTWNIGYGSDHSFVDLAGDFTVAHIHGPIAVQFPSPNTPANVRVGLPHTPGSSLRTGSFVGSATLLPADEASLFSNLLYVNIHSAFSTGGEIRGQLIPVVPEPATMGLALIGLVVLRRRFRR